MTGMRAHPTKFCVRGAHGAAMDGCTLEPRSTSLHRIGCPRCTSFLAQNTPCCALSRSLTAPPSHSLTPPPRALSP